MADQAIRERTLVHIDQPKGRFRVHRDAFRSAEIFAAEKELIFAKCWLYLGHVSELRNKGDYLARTVGGRDLIFIRSRAGELVAVFNTCAHRGARVCREKRGNAKNFSCPYHGWVYNTEGKLLSMNAERGFPQDINADGSLNLRRVPRLEEYRGFYFVSFDCVARVTTANDSAFFQTRFIVLNRFFGNARPDQRPDSQHRREKDEPPGPDDPPGMDRGEAR